jgi:triosephosphate isomerase
MKKNNNERRFFVGGNWKMNYSKSILEKVIETLNKTKDINGK